MLPAPTEVCGNWADDNCNGQVEEGCMLQQRSCAAPVPARCGLVTVAGGAFAMGEPTAVGATPTQTSITLMGSLAWDVYEVSVARFRRFEAAGAPAVVGTVRYPPGVPVAPGAVTTPSTGTTAAGCPPRPSGSGPRADATSGWRCRGCTRWGIADPMGGADAGACDRAQRNGCPGDPGAATRAVGSFAATGAMFDLAGNVHECTVDWFASYSAASCWGSTARSNPLCADATGGARTVRGGTYSSTTTASLHGASRFSAPPDDASPHVGLRCAHDR